MLRTQAGAGLDRGLLLCRPPLSSLGLGLLSLGTYVLEHAWTTSRPIPCAHAGSGSAVSRGARSTVGAWDVPEELDGRTAAVLPA